MRGCFEGSWDYQDPTQFDLVDAQTDHQERNVGSGVWYGVQGVQAIISAGRTRLYMHLSLPGSHSLHYAIQGSTIHFNTYAWPLIRKLKALGVNRPKIERAKEGVLYVFSKAGLKQYAGESWTAPEINERMTLEGAGPRLFEVLCEAAEDIYHRLGKPKVVAQLSAGTDSTLTVAALKCIGADMETVCVGRSLEDFDPRWAYSYAKELGVPFSLIQLPDRDDDLHELLINTISRIEQCDFSNVLMAMCTSLTLDFARTEKSPVVFHGHFADDLVGNEIITWGRYNKQRAEQGMDADSTSWRDYRAKESLCLFPNTVQVDKVSRAPGMTWRCLFSHPKVIDFIMRCPLHVIPPTGKKILYWEALKPHIKNPAWPDHRKIGYYTGSGIGKIRLENQLLSDASMRAIYQKLKP